MCADLLIWFGHCLRDIIIFDEWHLIYISNEVVTVVTDILLIDVVVFFRHR